MIHIAARLPHAGRPPQGDPVRHQVRGRVGDEHHQEAQGQRGRLFHFAPLELRWAAMMRRKCGDLKIFLYILNT